MFLDKTPYSHSASSAQVYKWSLHATETGISSSLEATWLVCRLYLPTFGLLLGVEDTADVQQQKTKGQKNEGNNEDNRFVELHEEGVRGVLFNRVVVW